MSQRRFKGIFTSGLLSILLAFSGIAQSHAIVSGAYVINPPAESPWAISLWVDQGNDEGPTFICSGTLISSQLVLTAGHCFQGIQGEFFVEVGATTLGTGKKIGVDAYWVSPRYNKSSIINDVAVGHLLLPHELKVYPRLDSSAKTGSSTKEKATIFGWGRDQNGEVTGDLRKTTVNFQTVSALRSFGRGFNTKTNLAAGTYIAKERIYTAACSGDSGGPLITGPLSKPVISGIVSYGPAESCNLTIPTVFSRVSYYLGDIATARNFVEARSQSNNLSAPAVLDPPVISGSLIPGATAFCSNGVWTSNALSYKKSWYVNPKGAKNFDDVEKVGEGESLVLTRAMFSKSLVCFVQASGSKRTGSKTVESSLPDLPMSVNFTSPSEGSAIAGKISLKGSSQSSTADDSSISKICLKLNGKVPSSGYYRGNTPISGYSDANGCIDSSSNEPYWDFDVTTWANGQYKFSFRAISRSGEVSNTVERILTVSNSGPEFEIASPAEGSTLAGKFVLKSIATPSGEGTADIAKNCLKLNGRVPTNGYYRGNTPISGYSDVDGCISSSSTEPYWEFDATNWANGTYIFSMNTVDSSGRKSSTVTRNLVVANESPSSSFTTPTESSILAGRITIKASSNVSATGTADIAKNCLKLNGRVPTNGYYRGNTPISGYSDVDGCISSSSTEPYWEFDTTSWENGSYQFTFYNIDSSGRTSNTSIRNLTIDNANPVALTRSPDPNSSVTGKFTLTGFAAPSDVGTATVARVCLLQDGSTPTSGYYRGNTPISGYSDSSGCISSSSTEPTWEFDSTSWIKKTYVFTYFVYDSSGRKSNVATWNIRVR